MSKKHHKHVTFPAPNSVPMVTTLLDKMADGREYESLVKFKSFNIDLVTEMRKAIAEIEAIRKRPLICYAANVVNSAIKAPISINYEDDLPFNEMISTLPPEVKDIDIFLVTPGGIAQQVAKFVDKLRPRFNNISFLLPNIAMSAGTIFVMSGDEIVMGPNSYIGPIDPQVPNKDGMYVPAQTILALIEEIKVRGEEYLKKSQNPPWTDLLILKQMDPKEIGNAITASKYSIELVQQYLFNYKFKSWTAHSSTGQPVTEAEKRDRAVKTAAYLCDHSQWKSHGRGITRDVAWQECKIKITPAENVSGLERSMRRYWALLYWVFENTPIAKCFISSNYCIVRNDKSLLPKKG